MKAAVLFGNEDIRYTDIKMPETRQGTVKIRVRASGICGSDVPRVFAHGAHSYPVVLGHEFSGEVAEVGEGVAGTPPIAVFGSATPTTASAMRPACCPVSKGSGRYVFRLPVPRCASGTADRA